MQIKILIAIIFSISQAIACEVQKIDNLNLMISTPDQSYVAYRDDRPLDNLPYFRATNCSNASMSGRYLMVALGPEVVDFDDTVKGLNFTRQYGSQRCEMTDSPYSINNSFEERLSRFKENWSFIDSCVEVVVEDEGSQKMVLPAVQPGCTVTKLTNHKISFNGGFCYFKPNFGSSYMIKLQVKPECLNVAHLQKLNIKISDFTGGLNLYLSSDVTGTGTSSSLSALSNLPVRVSINPLKNLVQASDDFGLLYPTWPETWTIPDIHQAKMKLKKPGNERVTIEMPFLVNNNCASKCEGNFCQSPCDYAQPIVAEFSLYQVLKSGKKEMFTSWYDGGVAPAHFQGFIQGIGFEVPEQYFEKGGEYFIETKFIDPKIDFEQFKKRIKNKLNKIEQQLGRFSRSNIPPIQNIPIIVDGQRMPGIGMVPNIIFGQPLDGVENAVERLRSFFSFRLWPPFYAQACLGQNCVQMTENFLNLGVSFKVSENESSEEILYDVINVSRNSKIVSSYDRKMFHLPSIKCEYVSKE